MDDAERLFHVNRQNGVRHLCIPPVVFPDVIQIAHGQGHPGFACCFEILTRSWYIQGLTRVLCNFICYCLECLIFQTRRHFPYGSLQPIFSPPVPFYTLTLNFIVVLPVALLGKFNAVMSVTCKYTKKSLSCPAKTLGQQKNGPRRCFHV